MIMISKIDNDMIKLARQMPLQTRAQKPDSYGSSFNKSHLNPQVLVQNRSEEFIRNQNGD